MTDTLSAKFNPEAWVKKLENNPTRDNLGRWLEDVKNLDAAGRNEIVQCLESRPYDEKIPYAAAAKEVALGVPTTPGNVSRVAYAMLKN